MSIQFSLSLITILISVLILKDPFFVGMAAEKVN